MPGVFVCGGDTIRQISETGFHAYGFEPFQALLQAHGHIMNQWQEVRKVIGQANLVTCIEALVHVRDPDDLLSRVSELLSSDGYFLISTATYNKRKHGADWYYLNPAGGHVSIFTRKFLGGLMSRRGLSSILRISGLVWLFRLVAQRKGTWLESGYSFASQSRIKLGIRLGVSSQICEILGPVVSGGLARMMRLYSGAPKACIRIVTDSRPHDLLSHLCQSIPITRVLETGTTVGLGWTTFIAEIFIGLSRAPQMFVTIEANHWCWRRAKKNFIGFPFVTPLWGIRCVSLGYA